MVSSEFYLFILVVCRNLQSWQSRVFIPSSTTINHHSLKLNSCIITHRKQMKYNYPQSNQGHPFKLHLKLIYLSSIKNVL